MKSLPLLVDTVLRKFDAEGFSLLLDFELLAGNFQHTGVSIDARRYIDHNSPPACYLIDGTFGDNQATFIKLASHARFPIISPGVRL
jgi:hypothetical protein